MAKEIQNFAKIKAKIVVIIRNRTRDSAPNKFMKMFEKISPTAHPPLLIVFKRVNWRPETSDSVVVVISI